MKWSDYIVNRKLILVAAFYLLFLRTMIDSGRVLKPIIILFLVFFSFQIVRAQEVSKLRSTLAVAGTSGKIVLQDREYYMQQTIGQSCAVGLAQNNNFQLRQGFIQPLVGSGEIIQPGSLQATIFPVPFSSNITISFPEEIVGNLYITLYDLNGRIVFLKKFRSPRELFLDVGFLPPAVYFIRLNTATKWFSSKIIKR